MKKLSITTISRAVIAIVFAAFIFSVPAFAQTTDNKGRSSDKLLMLPIGKTDQVFNLGIAHKAKLDSSTEIAYSNTALADFFFERIARQIDPKRVVLVTEDIVYKGREDSVETKPSCWITPTMKKMGFTKWVAADKRSYDEAETLKYGLAYRQVYSFMNEHYLQSYDDTKVRGYGLLKPEMTPKKDITDSAAKTLIPYLSVIAGDMSFEANLLRIRDKLADEGYVPIIVAGALHVLALSEPCAVQVPKNKEDAIKEIASDLYKIKGARIVLDIFLKKYDLEIVKMEK